MDVVLTTRLHGLVLALKHGVPALATDPVAGGAKISRQAETLSWPVIFTADRVTGQELSSAFDYCLRAEARAKAKECCARARELLHQVREQFVGELQPSGVFGKE